MKKIVSMFTMLLVVIFASVTLAACNRGGDRNNNNQTTQIRTLAEYRTELAKIEGVGNTIAVRSVSSSLTSSRTAILSADAVEHPNLVQVTNDGTVVTTQKWADGWFYALIENADDYVEMYVSFDDTTLTMIAYMRASGDNSLIEGNVGKDIWIKVERATTMEEIDSFYKEAHKAYDIINPDFYEEKTSSVEKPTEIAYDVKESSMDDLVGVVEKWYDYYVDDTVYGESQLDVDLTAYEDRLEIDISCKYNIDENTAIENTEKKQIKVGGQTMTFPPEVLALMS